MKTAESPPSQNEPRPHPLGPAADEFDLDGWIGTLRKRQGWILAGALACAVGALVYTLLAAPVWRAKATIVLNLSGSDRGEGAAGGAALATLNPNAPDPLQVYEGMLRSHRGENAVMYSTKADRKTVQNALKIERIPRAAQLSISWEDEDRGRALNAVKGAVYALGKIQQSVGFTAASEQAKYLLSAVDDRTRQLEAAESALTQYQKLMQAPSAAGDVESAGSYLKQQRSLELELSTIEASLKLARDQAREKVQLPELPTSAPNTKAFRDQLVNLQYQLEVARTQDGPESPQILLLERKIEVTRKMLHSEVEAYLKTIDSGTDSRIAELEADKYVTQFRLESVKQLARRAPEEALELARLDREAKTLTQVVADLRSRYEQARVAAQVERVQYGELDPPHIEDKPTNKRYARNPAMGFALGYIFFSVGAIFFSRRSALKGRS